jgi:hypothetical protein
MISKVQTPKEIRKKLLIKWERGDFYSKENQLFPYSVSTGRITSKDISANYDDLRQWISLYRTDSAATPYVKWETINNRLFGKNDFPVKLVFERIGDLAFFLNRHKEWKNFCGLIDRLHSADPRLGFWGCSHPIVLLELLNDLERLLLLWKWIFDHPEPQIYLRQIDLPGIDTKFTEKYKKTLSQWLDLTLPEEMISRDFTGISRFEERYGFKSKPELIRFRFLDSDLEWRGCSDISLPADQFCRLYKPDNPIPVERVFIVENDICGLAFPPLEKSMVVLGRGYYFENWKDARWLEEIPIYYWGDLDTHGYAILNQFREIFPRTKSILMDRKTLLDNEISWGREPKPVTSDLKNLTKVELELYNDMRYNRIEPNIRLEQEFIQYGQVVKALRSFV